MESPESWFEDFESAQLSGGAAQVVLDAGFADLISGSYHVFLSPLGESRGLYVTNKSPAGFDVRESDGRTSSIEFDYRVVAKRKDIEGRRLEVVAVPSPPRIAETEPPALTPVPEPPEVDRPPSL